MPIATTCPKCKAQFRLDEKLAGKKVRCQKCSEVFTVYAPVAPAPPPVEPAEPPPAANPPAPPPAISLSLEDAPIMADVVQPPPSEEVVEAELVQAPQQEEVVEAVLVEAPKRAKVVDEELAEPPPLPRSKSGKPPKDKPKASRRRAADLPKYSTVGPTLLGILGIILIGGALVACFAGAWFVLDMGKPKQARIIAPVVIMKDGKKADDRFPVVKGAQDNGFKDKDGPIFDVNRDLKKEEKGFPNFDKRDDKVVPFKDKDFPFFKDKAGELPEGPRNVAFLGDRYHRDDNLTPADEKNEQGPFKRYEISMEQGQGYNIDMKSRDIDAHLSLFDPGGKLVARDDNSGGDTDARILFDPKISGKYTLKAADAKKRMGAFALDIVQIQTPKSEVVRIQLNSVKRKDAGCDIVQADLGRSALGSHTFCWAPDGKSFFLLDRDGMLRRIRFPEFIEDQRLFVAKELAKIHLSAEGLLVSGIASREIWVVDPQSMQIKRRLPRTGSPVLLTSPELSFAYVTTTVTNKDGVKSQGLARYDLTKPEFVELEPFPSLQFLAITPDGRNVIGRDKDLKMVRWSIDDRKVTLAEQGTRVFRPWSSVIDPLLVSDDGKLLVHPINNKQFPKDDIQPGPASGYGIAGYRVNDFSKPAFVFDTGGLYAGATVDAKGELIAVHTRARGLLVCDREGKLLRELAITTQGTPNVPLTRLMFHPDGRRLIGFYGILTAPKVMSIELPKDLREDKSDK